MPQTLSPSGSTGMLRRRLPAVLIPALVLPVATLIFSLMQDKKYEGETSLLFRDTGSVLASAEPEREAATNVRLLQLQGVTDRVETKLGGRLEANVEVVAEAESNLATVIATSSSPERAARVANVYAKEYIELRRESRREELANETQDVRDALANLRPGARSGPEGDALRERKRSLRLAAVIPTGVQQVNPAEPPGSAVSPNPLRNTVVGALIGLALGVALAIALERGDRRVRDARFMEYVLGRPVIGRIPRSRELARSGPTTAALPPAEAEAFRTVRANLRRQLSERGSRSVLVTSALPREGKTTLAWNLARMEAALGSQVLLIEADMRRPVLAQSLGVDGSAGLSELLAGEAQLQDLIQPVRFENRQNGRPSPSSGGVDVLFAGTLPENPAELLDSERMQAVLEVVPDSYDLVVVDTPPALVSDAMPILDQVAGVVVVGRLGLSTDETLLALREQLDRLEAPTLGVVVNGDDSPRSRYGDYYRSQ